MLRSIQFKLAICFALAVLAGQLAIMAYWISYEWRPEPAEAQRFFQRRIQRTADIIGGMIEEGATLEQGARAITEPFRRRPNDPGSNAPERLVIDAGKRVVVNTLPEENNRLNPAEQELVDRALVVNPSEPIFKKNTETSAAIAVPVRHDRETIGVVFARMQVPTTWSMFWDRSRDRWRVWVAFSLLIATVFSLALSFLLTRRLREMTATVAAIAQGDLTRRLPVRARDEIGKLAGEFNAMTGKLQTVIGALESERDKLIVALERLGQAEASRRQLVADASHELRTPIACIQGNLEALIDEVIAEPRARREALVSVHEETLRLSRLVQDLLTLARSSVGPLEIRRESIAVDELVDRTVAKFRPRAESLGIALEAKAVDRGVRVLGDGDRLTQVLDNLIENAMQHTPEGGSVQLDAVRSKGNVSIRVGDTGAGIPQEDVPFVFERFFRSDKSRARSSGGTGLGLAIAREIIEAHGGSLGLQSEPGKGTRVFAELPVQPA